MNKDERVKQMISNIRKAEKIRKESGDKKTRTQCLIEAGVVPSSALPLAYLLEISGPEKMINFLRAK